MKRRWAFILILIISILSVPKIDANCAEDGFYNAQELQLGTVIDPEIVRGNEQWYYFTAPSGTADQWLILRLIGHQEKGHIYYELLDENLNMVKGSYTLSGTHMGEIVCRLDNTIEGTTGVYMPRLIREKKYYVKVTGTGTYSIGYNTTSDDFSGEYESATPLAVGYTVTGYIERDDDIDSFCFKVPTGNSYKIKVYATKKMNVRITDEDNYSVNTNSLRVMRDRGKSEYTISGYGAIRYFFIYGAGGTQYTIDVSINNDESTLGTWTKVKAPKGKKYVEVTTQKGAEITVVVKKGTGNKALKLKKIKKNSSLSIKKQNSTKVSATQKTKTYKYKLSRKLKAGDVVIVIASKKRYKEFNYKKKIK